MGGGGGDLCVKRSGMLIGKFKLNGNDCFSLLFFI